MSDADTDDGAPDEEIAVEEMDLDELRREIRDIDREIVELIAQRTYVAESIAAVKRDEGRPTTDEDQEQAVMDRAGENAERFDVDSNLVKAVFRLLIELNKVEQRSSRSSARLVPTILFRLLFSRFGFGEYHHLWPRWLEKTR
jgi:chorismate mutase